MEERTMKQWRVVILVLDLCVRQQTLSLMAVKQLPSDVHAATDQAPRTNLLLRKQLNCRLALV